MEECFGKGEMRKWGAALSGVFMRTHPKNPVVAGECTERHVARHMDPKEFDMPVASFNPNPMKLGLFTDGLPDVLFEQMLGTGCEMGIEELKFGTGSYSCVPHLDMEKLLHSVAARKEYLHAI